jgi:hypothetical protein
MHAHTRIDTSLAVRRCSSFIDYSLSFPAVTQALAIYQNICNKAPGAPIDSGAAPAHFDEATYEEAPLNEEEIFDHAQRKIDNEDASKRE